MKEHYFDYAAATPISPVVRRAMRHADRLFANPSSFNDAGRKVRGAVDEARRTVAQFLGARADEIVFAASGSEANALALRGAWEAIGKPGDHILVSAVEHASVLENAKALRDRGARVEVIPVDGQGIVAAEWLKKRVSSRSRLVSVMYANNEVGAIQPIQEIARIIRDYRRANNSLFPLLHVDACQAAGYLDMNVHRLGADFVTINGSKIYGPRGCGVLYVRRGCLMAGQVRGGSQEHGVRAGTENISSILGMAAAVRDVGGIQSRIREYRDLLIKGILRAIPDARLNGPVGSARLAGNVNISIPGVESQELLLALDRRKIRAGSGSACTAHSVEPSHVLRAMGVREPYLSGVVRFSLGRGTTAGDVRAVCEQLPRIVAQLRRRRNP